MKKILNFAARNKFALIVPALLVIAFVGVPSKQANASDFGLAINSGSFSFGLGIGDSSYYVAPSSTVIIDSGPRYVPAPYFRPLPPPPPPRPYYRPVPPPPPYYRPVPPPRPYYRPVPPPPHFRPGPPPRPYGPPRGPRGPF